MTHETENGVDYYDLDDAQEVGDLVLDIAHRLFEHLGMAEDFCVQTVGRAVVFGGQIRLAWSPLRGFRPIPSHCSTVFLDKWPAAYQAFLEAVDA
jgi:hypothetical protein